MELTKAEITRFREWLRLHSLDQLARHDRFRNAGGCDSAAVEASITRECFRYVATRLEDPAGVLDHAEPPRARKPD